MALAGEYFANTSSYNAIAQRVLWPITLFSIIALLLGRLRMSADEAKRAYTALFINLVPKMSSTSMTEKINLENTIRQIIRSTTGSSESKMVEEEGSPRCKVYVSGCHQLGP